MLHVWTEAASSPWHVFFSQYAEIWQGSWHLLLAGRQSYRPLANVSLPLGYKRRVSKIWLIPPSATRKLYVQSQVWQYWLEKPCPAVTNFTWTAEPFRSAQGMSQVIGADHSSTEDKQSTDKVTDVLGTDGENRDRRIPWKLWKNVKLKAFTAVATGKQPRPRGMSTHT